MISPAIALCALLAAADPSDAPEHHLVDMVVAQVDSTVITFSELVAETRLVLLKTGGPELARAASLSPSLLAAVLRSIVVRELVLGEVRRLKLRDVPDPEVKAALEALRGRFVSPADFERFLEKSGFGEPGAERLRELDAPPGLVASVTADLTVERFLDVRIGRNVIIRENDVFACYEANRASFDGRAYADVKNEIKQTIEDDQRQRAVEAMVDALERRATVRYTAGFEPPERDSDDGGGLRCTVAKDLPRTEAAR